MSRLRFNIPPTKEHVGWGDRWSEHTVRVVPEATWRKIVAVLNAEPLSAKWHESREALKKHLAKEPK